MPMGTHSERCVGQQILRWTGVTPECVIRVNLFDTVVEVAADVPIVAVTQQLHLVHKWEEIPVNVYCMMDKKEYIMDVVCQSSEVIEQRGEAEKKIQCTRLEAHEQRETLSHLVDCVNQQV